MELTRRGFLQGLAALVGVAALGLPPATSQELVGEVEEFLAVDHAFARPIGDWGSVRIGDTWYPLQSAAATAHYQFFDLDSDDVYRHMFHKITGISLDLELGDHLQTIGFVDREYEIEMRIKESLFQPQAVVSCKAFIRGYGNQTVNLFTGNGITYIQKSA